MIDLNATQAAVRAGYSKETANQIGSENLAKLGIQQRLSELKEDAAKKLEMTHTDVLMGFKSIYERSTQAEAVTDQDGEPIGEYKFDGSNANRALENIGKHVGFFEKDNGQKVSNLNITISKGEEKKIGEDLEEEV